MTVTQTETPYAELLAGEVRAELARRRISGRALARRTSHGAQYWWRRLSGEVPLGIDDLVELAAALDVSLSQLLEPVERAAERAADPEVDGPDDLLRARRDSNPQPSDP